MNEACPRCGVLYARGRFEACPRCLLDGEVDAPIIGDGIEVLEEVGHGGMGVVYRARHHRLGRTVAVKLLSPALAADAEFQRRLAREARALARLSHPHIVAVHDAGGEGDATYIVMEFVEGPSLAEILPVPVERALEMARQAAAALSYAHAHGVIHRDLKPGNMLVDGEGRLKITDFGLARLAADEPQWALTRAGQAMGTPQYASPEALRGAAPDPRMDVYSLGAVLYELVSGQPPLGDFASLSTPLDAIVRRALAPDPARRFASMDEMRRALDDAVQAPTLPRQPSAELRHWEHAAALLLTLSTAVVLWAVLLSITPRVLPPAEVAPLVMGPTERLADGRLVSRARFETGPALAAMAAVAAGLATLAHLRGRWREAGAGLSAPDPAGAASRRVVIIGIAANVVAALRRLLAARGYTSLALYTPLLGGIMEAVALFFFWSAVLEARRRGRPLAREFALWTGAALCLVPPVVELVSYLSSWRP